MSFIEAIMAGSLLVNLCLLMLTLALFSRGGRLQARTDVQALTATLTTHDERLKAVEKRIGELPTSASVDAIRTAVEKLDILVTGKLENVAMRLEHSDQARTALAAQGERERGVIVAAISRIEDFLMNQPKAA